jgi:hypothetical protein
MANGTFNGAALSAYSFDHQAAWERLRDEEKRKELQYQERVLSWISHKLAGETFDSLDALRERAYRVAVTERPDLTEQQARAIHFASTHLWAGLHDRRIRAERAYSAVGTVERLTIRVA